MPDRGGKPVIGFDGLLQHMRSLSGHCHGKDAFDSKGMAERVAARSRKRSNGKVGVYRCDQCRAWHIGNNNGWDGR